MQVVGGSGYAIVRIDGEGCHNTHLLYPTVVRVITWITPEPENRKWILRLHPEINAAFDLTYARLRSPRRRHKHHSGGYTPESCRGC